MKMARFFTLFLFCLPFAASAQGLPGVNDPLTLVLSPPSPGARQSVLIEARSFSFDINSAFITWSLNGKVVSQGTGLKNLSVTTGDFGTKTKISVTVQTSALGSFSTSATISPANVNLIWEANTSLPPFYKGKALHSWGSTYNVVAYPEIYQNGSLVSPYKLIYTWSKNYETDANASGYGKNLYRSDGAISYVQGKDNVDVKVSTSDGTISAENSIDIPNTNSGLLIYGESPVYGALYNQALSDTTLTEDSITLRAEPFFFSNATEALQSLSWNMNGVPVLDFSGNPSITLIRQDKNAGISNLSATIQSATYILQGAQKSITIHVNAK